MNIDRIHMYSVFHIRRGLQLWPVPVSMTMSSSIWSL